MKKKIQSRPDRLGQSRPHTDFSVLTVLAPILELLAVSAVDILGHFEDRNMKRLLLGYLASALALVATLPVQADEIQTTTETIQPPPLSQPQVVDSYMKPTVTQTKSVTSSDGNTQTSTAPMIMERHEHVVVPTSQTTTTTTEVAPKVTTEEVVQTHARASTTRRVAKHRIATSTRRPIVAHRHRTASASVAVSQSRRTTTVEPQVIQQTQTVEQKGVVIDRKDPALDNN